MKIWLIITLLIATPALAADITGIPRIVDGDTVQINATKIRLSGIDAPETDQVCLDPAGERWACGVTARDELVEHAGGKPWTCHVTRLDRYGRSLAGCEVDGRDINQWMVRSGWAMAFVRIATPMMLMRRWRATSSKAYGSGVSSRPGIGDTVAPAPPSWVPPACR
jgi:endonuclease YncB( thermonuclease family)